MARVLPLNAAYQFGIEAGYDKEVNDIKNMQIEWDQPPRPASVRRGYIVALFEENGLWERFCREHWPEFKTRDGQWRYRKYKQFKGDYDAWQKDAEEVHEDAEDEAKDPFAFALETQLRDFIAHNLDKLPLATQSLQLYKDEEGDGVEYPTDVGRIDILAVDQAGTFHVVELKVSRGPDRALGQLARYMGWVKRTLAKGKDVQGIVVARSIDEKLRYAASVVPNVTLLEYELKFKLNPAGPLAH